MGTTVFRNVRIIDGSGAAPFAGEVLVEGNRIAKVATGGERIDCPGASVIAGGGATLMPGLIESHAHLTFTSAVDRIVKEFMPPVERHLLYAAHNAKTLLDHGFTTMRLHRIEATCDPRNRASARVLEKAGLEREGVMRGHRFVHGEWGDSALYAKVAD